MAALELQVHPRLAELDAADAAQTASGEGGDSTPPPSPEAIAPEAAAVPPEPEAAVAAAPAVDPNEIRLRRGSITYKDMLDLAETDPQAKQFMQTIGGRHSARRYQETIAEQEAELATYRARNHQATLGQYDEAELAAKYLAGDPEVRAAVDASRTPEPTPEMIRDNARVIAEFESQAESAFDRALRRGGNDPQWSTIVGNIRQTAMQGQWDRTVPRYLPTGNQQQPWAENPAWATAPEAHPLQQAAALRTALEDATDGWIHHQTAQARAAAQVPPMTQQAAPPPVAQAAAPVPAPVAVPNPALAAAGPDVSAPSIPASNGVTYKMSDIKTWPPPKRFEVWPNEGDFQRDVAAGKVLMDT